jgi:hypothetical protein
VNEEFLKEVQLNKPLGLKYCMLSLMPSLEGKQVYDMTQLVGKESLYK